MRLPPWLHMPIQSQMICQAINLFIIWWAGCSRQSRMQNMQTIGTERERIHLEPNKLDSLFSQMNPHVTACLIRHDQISLPK